MMAAASPHSAKPDRKPSAPAKPRLTSARALGLGLEFGTAIAGLAVLGYFLDEYFQTEPVLALTGAGLGLVGGVYNVIRAVSRLSR